MKKYLISEKGNFYKVNLHSHSKFSDGRYTPEQIKALYKELGYSAVAFTDHDVYITHNDLTDNEFVALNGFEIEVGAIPKTCHICMVALEPDNDIHPLWHRSKYLFRNATEYRDLVKFDENKPDFEREFTPECINEIIRTGIEQGFFVTYNHPSWSMEDYSDYMNYNGMHAMEMFNGVCLVLGYEDYNNHQYDDMLRGGKKLYCVGGDDNHNIVEDRNSRQFASGVAFTVVKAEKLEYKALTDALLKGDFYASTGPEIHELWYEDGKVYIKCSQADRVYCTFGIRRAGIVYAENNIPVTEASFGIPENCGYFRLTVVDEKGNRACTNAYFMEDISK